MTMIMTTTETTRMGTFLMNGWTPPVDTMPEDEWRAALRDVSTAQDSRMWQLGDLWAYGDRTYGNRKALTQAPDWRGPSFDHCAHAAVVAKAFKETWRRRQTLSFKHHREVAALPDQAADKLLDWAEREHKSTRELREQVKRWKQNPSGEDVARRVEDYLAQHALSEGTQAKLRITARRAPDLAARVVAGELKINSAWVAARDLDAEKRNRMNAERDEKIARRRAEARTGAVVISLRRTVEEEQAHIRSAAADLLEASRVLRRVTNANVSANSLMHALNHQDRYEIEAALHTGMAFLRNVITTWTINRSHEDEHTGQASGSGSGTSSGVLSNQ